VVRYRKNYHHLLETNKGGNKRDQKTRWAKRIQYQSKNRDIARRKGIEQGSKRSNQGEKVTELKGVTACGGRGECRKSKKKGKKNESGENRAARRKRLKRKKKGGKRKQGGIKQQVKKGSKINMPPEREREGGKGGGGAGLQGKKAQEKKSRPFVLEVKHAPSEEKLELAEDDLTKKR